MDDHATESTADVLLALRCGYTLPDTQRQGTARNLRGVFDESDAVYRRVLSVKTCHRRLLSRQTRIGALRVCAGGGIFELAHNFGFAPHVGTAALRRGCPDRTLCPAIVPAWEGGGQFLGVRRRRPTRAATHF